MLVGSFQFDVAFNNKQQNLTTINQGLMESDFDLMVLPELCTSGCTFSSDQQPRELAEPVPGGETTDTLIRIAKARNGYIVAGLIEEDGGVLYNTAVIVGPEGYVGKQRKMNLSPSDSRFFQPGTHIAPFKILGIGVGVLVCYDLWFTETMMTILRQDVQLLVNPANFCGYDSLDAIEYSTRGSRLPMVATNRLGTDPLFDTNIQFIGQSLILDGDGNTLASAGSEQAVITYKLDLQG